MAETAMATAYAEYLKTKAIIDALPKSTQERIEQLQLKMVQTWEGFGTLPPEDQEDLIGLTIYLSHCEAHEWADHAAMLKAMPPPVAGQSPVPGPQAQGQPQVAA
jgi:hypothetical protein